MDAIYFSRVFSKLMDVFILRCNCAHENILVSFKTFCYLVRLGYYSLQIFVSHGCNDSSLLCMLLSL